MRRIILGLSLLTLGASMGWATLVIDDFTSLDPGQTGLVADPTGGSCAGSASPQTFGGTNAIGARQVSLSHTGGGCAALAVAAAGSDFVSLALGQGITPSNGMATIQWDPADQLGFSTDLQAQGILEFLYRVDSGAVINNVQNQSSVTFEFCLEGGVCMSRTQTFIGQVIPAEVFTWAFTGFTNYAAFWTALQNGTLVDYVRLTLVGTNDQDLIIDQIVANAAVPEPSTMLLIGPGLLGVAWLRRRRKV